jgi:D-2-hydroxyglutarate dehydrogenase
VVPQGGNTGLVGGGVPLSHEVVLSLERLRDVHSFDEDSGVVVCGGGLVLQALDEALGARGWMVPLDLGSKGSCAVGGNVATNAGGLRLLRYGSLHGSVLGLEVVTARGETLDMLSTLRKDNVGFDLKQLFIGSEGALGVVTRVALLAAPRPASVNVAVFGVGSFDNCRRLLRLARLTLGETLSAAEYVDGAAMALTLKTLGLRSPFEGAAAFNFFVETAGCNAAHDAEKLSAFVERASEEGLIADGVVAADASQARRLFRLREDVSVALSQRGHVFKYDVSLRRLADMDLLVREMRERLRGRGWSELGVETVGYGHIGDGNLHLNISTNGRRQAYLQRLEGDIEPFVYARVLELGGSVSAEHGVGQAKVEWVARSRAPPVVALMRSVKGLLDPSGTLNPGKVLTQ